MRHVILTSDANFTTIKWKSNYATNILFGDSEYLIFNLKLVISNVPPDKVIQVIGIHYYIWITKKMTETDISDQLVELWW